MMASSLPLSFLLLLVLSPMAASASGAAGQCDWYKGSWEKDPSYPLYDSKSCPFIRKEFDCFRYGRQDADYLKYRWQPAGGCALPSFDGRDLMNRLQGKKIMFVGDSLTLNQYNSFLCLLHSAAPSGAFNQSRNGHGLSTVTFQEYNLTVQYFPSHYLVEISPEKELGRVMHLDRISNASGAIWASADVLLFNSWHWWLSTGSRQEWDYFRNGKQTVKEMNRTEAFGIAFMTWARWSQSKILPPATKVFFQGISPAHYHGQDWGDKASSTCMGQTEPSTPSEFVGAPIPQNEEVVKPSLRKLREALGQQWRPIYLLDTTYLSQLRKDAHPSKYNGVHFRNDCSHWCVAGLPDTWNLILYAALVQDDPPSGY